MDNRFGAQSVNHLGGGGYEKFFGTGQNLFYDLTTRRQNVMTDADVNYGMTFAPCCYEVTGVVAP